MTGKDSSAGTYWFFACIFNFYTPSSFSVYADVKDPAQKENYYRWSFYSWMPRQTHGIRCGFRCVMFEFCYQKNVDKEFRILSDAALNGNEIKDQLMGSSYIYAFGKHYIDIGQHSLTREAYKFAERFKEQQTRTGTTLDPLPASIKGNVYNAADSNDFALGYFSASSVTHKRVILVPYSLTQFLLDITAATFIPEG